MRKFSEILIESKKTYEFIVRVAGELPEGFQERLKTSLEKFSLIKLTGPKRTPIQEKPLDFPQLQNMEVHTFEVEVNYPTVNNILERYIVETCNVDHSRVVVRVPGEPVELQQSLESNEQTYEPVLTTEELGGESAQQAVAGNRIMDLLKELEVARKERDIEPSGDVAKGDSKDISDSTNNKAIVGG